MSVSDAKMFLAQARETLQNRGMEHCQEIGVVLDRALGAVRKAATAGGGLPASESENDAISNRLEGIAGQLESDYACFVNANSQDRIQDNLGDLAHTLTADDSSWRDIQLAATDAQTIWRNEWGYDPESPRPGGHLQMLSSEDVRGPERDPVQGGGGGGSDGLPDSHVNEKGREALQSLQDGAECELIDQQMKEFLRGVEDITQHSDAVDPASLPGLIEVVRNIASEVGGFPLDRCFATETASADLSDELMQFARRLEESGAHGEAGKSAVRDMRDAWERYWVQSPKAISRQGGAGQPGSGYEKLVGKAMQALDGEDCLEINRELNDLSGKMFAQRKQIIELSQGDRERLAQRLQQLADRLTSAPIGACFNRGDKSLALIADRIESVASRVESGHQGDLLDGAKRLQSTLSDEMDLQATTVEEMKEAKQADPEAEARESCQAMMGELMRQGMQICGDGDVQAVADELRSIDGVDVHRAEEAEHRHDDQDYFDLTVHPQVSGTRVPKILHRHGFLIDVAQSGQKREDQPGSQCPLVVQAHR